MMKLNLAFVAVVVAACTDPAPVDDMVVTGPPLVLIEGPRGEMTQVFGLGEAPIEIPGSPCDCRTQDCFPKWIEENLGHGLCGELRCADGSTDTVPCVPERELRIDPNDELQR